MSNIVEQAKARAVRQELNRRGLMPAALRAPIDAVIQSQEKPGTARDILESAYIALGYKNPKQLAKS